MIVNTGKLQYLDCIKKSSILQKAQSEKEDLETRLDLIKWVKAFQKWPKKRSACAQSLFSEENSSCVKDTATFLLEEPRDRCQKNDGDVICSLRKTFLFTAVLPTVKEES